jgi:pyrroline-5-carboxylate reductase
VIGFIGSGNMARALARGWGDPVLATDSGSGRAAALVAELGGEVPASNAELARRADLVVLAHKPAQLEAVAAELAGSTTPVVSLLGNTPLERVRAAHPAAPVLRVEPNTPVELRRGVSIFSDPGPSVDPELARTVHELFERVGTVIDLPDHLVAAAGATSGVGPAYVALVAEAMTDAAVRRGIPAPKASALVAGTLAGTAEMLLGGADTLAIRRAVSSPGGSTARGLAALEHGGLRSAFHHAIDGAMGG